MFQSSSQRLRAWLDWAEDFLGDEPAAAPPHPHRQPLSWNRQRRRGSVAPPPAHCISPVRTTRRAVERDRAAS